MNVQRRHGVRSSGLCSCRGPSGLSGQAISQTHPEGEETAVGPGLGTGRRGSVNGPTGSSLRRSVISLSVLPGPMQRHASNTSLLQAELYSRLHSDKRVTADAGNTNSRCRNSEMAGVRKLCQVPKS